MRYFGIVFDDGNLIVYKNHLQLPKIINHTSKHIQNKIIWCGEVAPIGGSINFFSSSPDGSLSLLTNKVNILDDECFLSSKLICNDSIDAGDLVINIDDLRLNDFEKIKSLNCSIFNFLNGGFDSIYFLNEAFLKSAVKALHRERLLSYKTVCDFCTSNGFPQPEAELFGINESSDVLNDLGLNIS